MAFWGIEIKPGKPYVHLYDDEKGRLHISQATLGNGTSEKKSVVQCIVGDKKPVYLCSLLPERLETCALNLEFDEDDGEVTLSVNGPHSVHLTGYFYGEAEEEDYDHDGHDQCGEDCESDDYEEGVMMTDDSEDESVYDSEDEDEDDEFSDDEFGVYPSSPVPNSGVKIEEIVDEEKPTNESGLSKKAKKKKNQSSMSKDNENSDRQIVVKGGSAAPILESEDEDGFPTSARDKSVKSNTGAKSEENTDTATGKTLKRKIDAVVQDVEPTRENSELDTITPETQSKKKKNKKKKGAEKVESAQEIELPNSKGAVEQTPVAETGSDVKPSAETKKEKKKKKQQDKKQEIAATPTSEEKPTAKKAPVVEKQDKAEAKSSQVRTFPNGLVIEELAMGKPNGERANPGKKVSVRYVGKLKKNGKIFDSNIGKSPFKFRLGIGQVIKGWDVGVKGMRVGDKRRLTIPPAMGYGAKGSPPVIPQNAWLVFDVELIEVD